MSSPRREWWSFLCARRCSVSWLMRSVSSATCTRVFPVSRSSLPNCLVSSAFLSCVKGMATWQGSRVPAPTNARPHGSFLASEAGELAGVSGTTIGQWARRGLIRSSISDDDPRVYSVEDVAEAALVRALLDRGIRHADVHRTIARLRPYGPWPLSEAALATTDETAPRIVLREDDGDWVLTARGWQKPAAPPPLRDVRLRLRRTG